MPRALAGGTLSGVHDDPDAPLAAHLACIARELGLNSLTLDDAPDDRVRELCRVLLDDLAARGLLPGVPDVGCHARVAEGGN